MNGVQALKGALDASHTWYQGTIADLTPEIGNYLPAGNAHPISAIVVHAIQSEDFIIAQMIGGGQSLWEKEGWGEKLKIPNMYLQDQEMARGFKGDPAAIGEYAKAVYGQSDAYFQQLKDEDLDRVIDLGAPLGQMPVGIVLSFFLIGNNFAHTGEIAATKGIQGKKGYPF